LVALTWLAAAASSTPTLLVSWSTWLCSVEIWPLSGASACSTASAICSLVMAEGVSAT
jgi:hypothetical protein